MFVAAMYSSVFVRECIVHKIYENVSEILETYLMQLLSFVSYIETQILPSIVIQDSKMNKDCDRSMSYE